MKIVIIGSIVLVVLLGALFIVTYNGGDSSPKSSYSNPSSNDSDLKNFRLQ